MARPGSATWAAAYQALDDATKQRIEGLVVEHRHGVSVAARPGDHVPVPPRGWDQSRTAYHPLVRRHPVTGTKTLYAPTGTSQGIRGMAPGPATALLQALCDHAFQDRFITQHAHRTHDLVMWDNPTVMHCATPLAVATMPEDTRLIHRISLRGGTAGVGIGAALVCENERHWPGVAKGTVPSTFDQAGTAAGPALLGQFVGSSSTHVRR